MPNTNRIIQALLIAGIVILAGMVFYPIFVSPRSNHHRRSCLSFVKQLAMASIIYASDHDERLMERDSWMDAIDPYHKNKSLEHCPGIEWQFSRNPSLYGFAFNSKLSLKKLIEDPNVPLIYDSINLARSASDPFTSLPSPPRVHHEGAKGANYLAYADGHARALTK